MRGCGLNIFGIFFYGESETKSWVKSRSFRFGLSEDVLSKGKEPYRGKKDLFILYMRATCSELQSNIGIIQEM